jgi:hypothetical protein
MVEITKELVDTRISAKEGFTVAMENNVFTILETTITPELTMEGLARELVSKVQQMRKQKDFEMMDHIAISVKADDEVKAEHIGYLLESLYELRKVSERYVSMFENAVYEHSVYIVVGTDDTVQETNVFIAVCYMFVFFHAYNSDSVLQIVH